MLINFFFVFKFYFWKIMHRICNWIKFIYIYLPSDSAFLPDSSLPALDFSSITGATVNSSIYN
jgi:hypothetical protein